MLKANRIIFAIGILMLLFFAGCTSNKMSSLGKVQLASDTEDSEAKTFVTSDSKSSIYIYREQAAGTQITFQVTLDGKSIGYFVPNRFYLLKVEPGDHSIQVLTNKNANLKYNEVDNLVNINTKPGENYFIKANVWMGLNAVRVKVTQVDESVGMKMVGKSKLAKSIIS